MSEQNAPVKITATRARKPWMVVVILLASLGWLVQDVAYFGTVRPIGIGAVVSAIVAVLLYAALWKLSFSRFRTPIALLMVIIIVAEVATGHYHTVDTLTLIKDVVFLGGIMALSLAKWSKTSASYDEVEDALGWNQKPKG
ncbi:MAG TPA: hypothetical protein VLA88_02400 [Candidatus Saccharimonadales bacterium]|nr:hypothetical protein [Candidatus Saccharimonadales bacterium]